MCRDDAPRPGHLTAGWTDLAVAGLRTVHVLEVLAALVLLFHPSSTRDFRHR